MGDANAKAKAKAILVVEDDETNDTFSFHHQAKTPPPTSFLQRLLTPQAGLKPTQFSNITPSKRPLDLDLNLSLGLGGSYTPGNTGDMLLARSSSLAAATGEELDKSWPTGSLPLPRSRSLPAEVEWSKRAELNAKELRVIRRYEAKKRVAEKQMNVANYKANEKEKFVMMEGPPSLPSNNIPAWAAAYAAQNPALARALNAANYKANEKEKFVMEGPPSSPSKIPAWAAASAAQNPALHRAISRIQEGLRKMGGLEGFAAPKVRDPLQSLKAIKTEPVFTSAAMLKAAESNFEFPTKRAKAYGNGGIGDDGMEVMKMMPSVSTTGDGPNGRRIEGFLYTYLKGKVSIVCVCHGNFLSPEEFVKHAGRKDVTNPMKHIRVSFSY